MNAYWHVSIRRFSDQVSRRQAEESLQTRRSQCVIQCAHAGSKKGPLYGDACQGPVSCNHGARTA